MFIIYIVILLFISVGCSHNGNLNNDRVSYSADKSIAATIKKDNEINYKNEINDVLYPALSITTNKYGYINKEGHWIIEPRFDEVAYPLNWLPSVELKLFPAKLNGKWGYVDNSGKWIITPEYLDCHYFEAGIASVTNDLQMYFFINEKGERVNEKVVGTSIFSEELALKSGTPLEDLKNGAEELFGYINREGDWIIPAQLKLPPDSYKWGRPYKFNFHDGLAVAYKEGYFGFLNKKGVWEISATFEDATPFSEKLSAVCYQNKWGYIDENGDWAIEPQYENALEFNDGLAAVCSNGTWGYIDQNNQWIIKPNIAFIFYGNDVFKFSNGVAKVATINQDGAYVYGYIDKEGNWMIQPQFTEATLFREGVAAVILEKDNTTIFGYIDKNGRYIYKWNENI